MAFKLSDGTTFEPRYPGHDGRYMAVLAERKRDDNGEYLLKMDEKTKAMPDKRHVSSNLQYANVDTRERTSVTDTYFLAENENYEEYPTVSEYIDNGFASNCAYQQKIEILFRVDDYTTRLFLEWKGEASLYDQLSNLESIIEDEISDGNLVEQGFKWDEDDDRYVLTTLYNDNTGDVISEDMDFRDLLHSIASVRVIEYTERIIKDN